MTELCICPLGTCEGKPAAECSEVQAIRQVRQTVADEYRRMGVPEERAVENLARGDHENIQRLTRLGRYNNNNDSE